MLPASLVLGATAPESNLSAERRESPAWGRLLQTASVSNTACRSLAAAVTVPTCHGAFPALHSVLIAWCVLFIYGLLHDAHGWLCVGPEMGLFGQGKG